jgi:hypothetical protein
LTTHLGDEKHDSAGCGSGHSRTDHSCRRDAESLVIGGLGSLFWHWWLGGSCVLDTFLRGKPPLCLAADWVRLLWLSPGRNLARHSSGPTALSGGPRRSRPSRRTCCGRSVPRGDHTPAFALLRQPPPRHRFVCSLPFTSAAFQNPCGLLRVVYKTVAIW